MAFFPPKKQMAATAIIAVLAVGLAAGLGLLSPVTRVIGRATGAVKSTLKRVFGVENRGV